MRTFLTVGVCLNALATTVAGLFINETAAGTIIAPCDSPLYCVGDILAAIELARPFVDSKTFVDLPTVRPLNEVIAAFNALPRPITNDTALNTFLTTYFGPAGTELAPVPASQLQTDPTFLNDVDDPIVREFVREVIAIWPQLTRQYVGGGSLCDGCVSSFLPLNRTFVVAGGRFREPYYWDSFWIVEGLVRTGGSFVQIARNIIENFLDYVEQFGFVPNGGRAYYLNRSQPPLLTQMVAVYISYTNDTSILDRALPILEEEYQFWVNNRSVTVTVNGQSYTLNQYNVANNQPRPESFREDYETANNISYFARSGIIYPQTQPLTAAEKATLYANLASGAESGWDYTTRWLRNPNDAVRDVYFPLRSLNTIQIVPVDLNSILYMNERSLSSFFNIACDYDAADNYAALAANRSAAMTAVLYNTTHDLYFDYNISSSSHNLWVAADENALPSETTLAGAPAGYQLLFSPSQYYPYWTGAAPSYIRQNPLAIEQAYSRIATYLSLLDGGIPATNLFTGQQWDEPNVWPPLQYILMQGLLNTPATFGTSDPSYQATQDLALQLAQRYVDSTFCTWRATGGDLNANGVVLPQLPGSTGNGIIFEKYAQNSTNQAGGGGEYAVVQGFGWTNGVLIWAADVFGDRLVTPDCGNITAATVVEKRSMSAVEMHPRDLQWVKRF